MPIYQRADKSIHDQCMRMLKAHHPGLRDAGVSIACVMAHAKTDDNGEPIEQALKLHGYACNAVIKIMSLKDRAMGRADAEITIDGDRWPMWSEAQQDALLDHELEHPTEQEVGSMFTNGVPRRRCRLQTQTNRLALLHSLCAFDQRIEYRPGRDPCDARGELMNATIERSKSQPAPAPTDPPLMTIAQAMARLGCSRTSLYELIDAGLIERVYLKAPPRKDGTAREDWPRIKRESVERYERGEASPKSQQRGLVKPRPRPASPAKRGIRLPATMKEFRSSQDR